MVVAVRRVVVLGHIDPLEHGARVTNVHAVNLRLELVVDGWDLGGTHAVRVCVVVGLECKELDGVSQSQLLHVGGCDGDAVHLGDQQVHRCVGKVLTLRLVQVDEVGPGLVLERGVGGSRRQTRQCERRTQVRAPRDANLDVVILERHQGQRHVPVLAEEKLERQEPIGDVCRTSAVVEEALGEVLGTSHRLDARHPRDVLCVDNLTTDEQLDLVDDVSPVDAWNQSTSRISGNQVHVVDEVTLLLQTDRGDVTSRGVTLDQLAFGRVGVVRVAFVAGTVERNLWLTGQPSVLSTGRDKLNDTTRHLQWREKKTGLETDTENFAPAVER